MTVFARLLAGLVVLLAATAGALVLTAGPAVACSCVQPSADFIETQDVAFSGVVTDRRDAGDDTILTFRTDRVYKGEITNRVDVVSGGKGDTCGLDAHVDDRLLVFGQLVDGEVTSNLCSSMASPGKAYREITAELGTGTAPKVGYMKAERRGPGLTYEQFSAGRAVLGVLGLTGLAYFAFLFWRGRRRTT